MRVAVVMAAFVAALVPSGHAQRAADPAARHVVLISIDGFAAYHLRNLAVDLPNIRALAAAGTAADSSETVFPSVTHPSHTTLITGVTPRLHGVVENRVVDRRTGERFHITNLPRRESIRVPTLFDAVRARGLKSAAFFWPETRDDGAIDDNVTEVFAADGSADPKAVNPALLAELRGAGVPIDSYYAFYDDPFAQGAADIALTRAAAYVLAKRKPALTALHLLVTDKVQHEFGPQHYLSAAALTVADHCVGLMRKAVADAGLSDQTTFVIAGDHGFASVGTEVNVASVINDPLLEGRVRWRDDQWYLFAELLPTFDRSRDGPVLDRVLARLKALPGVARVIPSSEFAALGYPDYDANIYVPGHYIVVADIDTFLVNDAKTAGTARRSRPQPYHGHGYLPQHSLMHPALVLSGAGIASGKTLGHVSNVDVAPTIAALLGLDLPSATGRVLRAALR